MVEGETLVVHKEMMELALVQAKDALAAGEFPVGCVLAVGETVVATGQRTSSMNSANEIDHAEIIALRKLVESGECPDLSGITVYSTLEPCLMCYSTLLVNGVTKIVYAYEDAMGGGTCLPLQQLTPLYRDLHPVIIPHVLREQSLALFKEFFAQADDVYLAGTYLAQYTLQQ